MIKLVFATLLIVTAPLSVAECRVIQQPLELEPGDQYRIVFLTSEFRDASSTDINDYNQFVQDVANSSEEVREWGYEWKAVASTEEVDARDNTDTNWLHGDGNGVPIYRIDGVRLVDDYRGLWSAVPFDISVIGGVNRTEIGKAIEPFHRDDPARVISWSGTRNDGTGWRSRDGIQGSYVLGTGNSPVVGFSDVDVSLHWVSGLSNESYFVELPVLAISETITAVPEPSSVRLAFYFLLVLVSRRGRHGAG